MCMKYLNANTTCFENVVLDSNNMPSFYARPFDAIVATKTHDGYVLKPFFVVSDISILGTNNEMHKKDNVLESGSVLEFKIRLTKCAEDPEKRLCVDLDTFNVDCSTIQTQKACYGFANLVHITEVENLRISNDAFGKYVIKVLVKRSTEEQYTIQTMSMLIIKNPDSDD